ncbi:U1 small nuclear ribonucleoprotein C [Clonorchis sinensis]|uniref:U1 small nuclear ribonucleoprotein C n=1 Tax=Clonorchis sinensis TaxID=79923 RepID=A0A419PKY8_CLOSI|nr:U1 small nuclear ribonucleoprotein C [Clonorchis sinensis]
MIQRTFSRITRMNFQVLCGAYVRQLLEYASQVVYSGRAKDVTLIELVQQAATKMVAEFRSMDYETRLLMFDLLPLGYLRLREDLILIYAQFEQGLVNRFFSRLDPANTAGRGERQPLNDKDKTESGNLGDSLDLVYQSDTTPGVEPFAGCRVIVIAAGFRDAKVIPFPNWIHLRLRYYCDYCDTYLTHDSPSVRKTHCGGRNHKDNVRDYYQKWLEEQVQKLVDHTSEAYKQGKMPPPLFGSPLGMPPPGLAYPPRFPPVAVPPGYRGPTPMVPPQGMMMPPRVGMPGMPGMPGMAGWPPAPTGAGMPPYTAPPQ